MSNSKKCKIRKIICSFALCLGFITSAFSGLSFAKNKAMEVIAETGGYSNNYIKQDVYTEDSSSARYYSFYTTSSSRPATVNGWSEIDDEERVSFVDDNVVRGIVDLTPNNSTWSKEIYHTTQPTMPLESSSDKSYFKNLMINSHNGSSSFGYKSNSISLEADSYYSIEVTLHTQKVTDDEDNPIDPTASIYLTGLVDEDSELAEQVKFENFSTLGKWETYKFYISTNKSATVNLELWLGSENNTSPGAVFFNNVDIVRYSEAYYYDFFADVYDDENNDSRNFIELKSNYTTPVSNSSFEDIPNTSWKPLEQSTSNGTDQLSRVVDVINYSLTDGTTKITAPGSNCAKNNENAYFLYNKIDAYQGIESTQFEIKQHSYYKLSFWAKSNCNVGNGAIVKLVDKSDKGAIDSSELTLATTYTADSNKFRNDWTNYAFYIYGPANSSKNVAIQILLGTSEKKTTGYVFVDDFRLEEINYETYNSNSSSTNSTTFNLNNDADNFTIKNSYFDRTENTDNSATYPLTPAGWTKSGSENNTFSGVINTDPTHFNANLDNYYNGGVAPNNPGKLSYMTSNANNVLMIGSANGETNTQTYTSSSIDLSADSYYRISFYIYTQYTDIYDNIDSGASVKLSSGAKILYTQKNILFDDEQWHKYEIYIKTGSIAYTSNLSFVFEKLNGYIFVDDVKVEKSTETAYNNYGYYQNPSIEYNRINLSVENFDNRTFGSKLEIQEELSNWTATEQNNKSVSTSGIINYDNTLLNGISKAPSENDNVLYINSIKDVNYYYTSKDSYTFTANQYYKISLNVLTKDLGKESNEEGLEYGASFGLSDYDNKKVYYTNIDTNGEWKTLNMYILLTSDTNSTISLGLGYTDNFVSGTVIFDNLKVEKIEETTFQDEIADANNLYFKAFINHAPEAVEEDAETEEWSNDFDWVIIPSLLTALAIIIAIVGFYIKKINWSRKPKIKTKYDRRKTLDKDIDKREKIALRKQIIQELNDELIAIDKEIEEYNKLAEQQLAQIKEKIQQEQEELKRKKLEIEIKKKEAKAEREKQLKDNPELVSNTKAEKEFVNFINKLDKQELNIQKQLSAQDVKLANSQVEKTNINKFLERKEFIKNEIAKIEAEIEEIMKEEEEMWAEYKAAKLEAKKRKAEYKEQVKKEKAKASTSKTTTSKPENTNKTTENSKKEKEDSNIEVIEPDKKD